jgi:hypothetical protein
MFNLFQNADLPSFVTLFNEINSDIGNGHIWLILVSACLMLAVHAIVVLSIAGAFHYIDDVMTRHRIFGASFLSYFIAIFLVIAIHFAEIIIWAYICVSMKVFPTNPQTFFFAGEMYTTVGYGNYKLMEQWRILPMIISFTGIFAVSMSGAALYTMMGSLINKGNNQSNKTRD